MFITDAQVHIWELSTPQRPWPSPPRPAPPHRPQPFSKDDLLREMDAAGGRRVLVAVRHGAIAPPLIDWSGSGTINSGSTSNVVPRPSHASHAPYGELNEKLRGAGSS